jgi:hypothetical protein
LHFKKLSSYCTDHMLIVGGEWLSSKHHCYLINVYAPQVEAARVTLWNEILYFMQSNSGNYIIFRDFNSVRSMEERRGCSYSATNASNFNSFIESGGLVDVPMGGFKFTRVGEKNGKFSKLDRFLLSNQWSSMYPSLEALALERTLSDHRPIVLRSKTVDYGPSPFKLFNSWLLVDDFNMLIMDSWRLLSIGSCENIMVAFKNNLKELKRRVKVWIASRPSNDASLSKLKTELQALDSKLDIGPDVNVSDLEARSRIMNRIAELDRLNSMDLLRKSKIKWGIEGDENSKYFHAIINNKKRRHSSIRGIKVDGSWVEDLVSVKDLFYDFVKNKFSRFGEIQMSRRSPRFRSLSSSPCEFLEAPPSVQEIKNAVWACGSSKSPGPDGFSFGFLKKH